MFQAKTFYALTGLKRSTVRYYQELGLISPAAVGENGYSYYDDHALVDAMLARNYRGVDFTVKDMVDPGKFRLEAQIGHLEELAQGYREEIARLERKVRMTETYSEVMKQYRRLGEITRGSAQGMDLRHFFIREALEEDPAAGEEIAQCVNSFPFVHIITRGRLEELEERGRMRMEPGYAYRADRGLYTPVRPALYTRADPSTRLRVRLQVGDPMTLTGEDLAPLLEEMDRRGLPRRGMLYTTVPGVEEIQGKRRYFICVWTIVAGKEEKSS